MALKFTECPVALAIDFDRHGGGPAIINSLTRERLTPQQIVAAYNTVALELAKLIQSDVD